MRVQYESRNWRILLPSALAMTLTVVGCNGIPGGSGESEDPSSLENSAHALINFDVVPSGVFCVDIRVHGSDRTVDLRFPVRPGERASLRSAGLPTGPVTFVAEAFDVACESISSETLANWRSTPVETTLLPASTAVVMLTLRRNGIAEVSFGFEFAQECDPTASVCAESELCFVLSCGDRIGGCLDRPETCPAHYDPVCACNGVTYANSCEAARAGQSVQHRGACTCGGTSGATCPPGYFCQYEPGTCGAANRTGVCAAPVVSCPSESAPVCGCNGRTYSNVCTLTAAGQSVDHMGACIPPVCGGPNRIPCADFAMSCFFPEGACANPNAFGECRLRPLACPLGFNQVCACNGVTYSTECRANLLGLSILSRGPCP